MIDPMSQSEPPFSVRLGRLVEAKGRDGGAVELGYGACEDVIAILLDNGPRLTREIFERVNAPGFSVCDAKTNEEILKREGVEPGRTARTSHVLPAVDLEDICVTINERIFLMRPSITVCATFTPNQAEKSGHLPVYSKVWFRFIALGEIAIPGDQSPSDVYQAAQDVSAALFESAYKTYGEVISSVCGPGTTIHKVGEIEIYSDTVEKPQFLELVSAISCASRSRAPGEVVNIPDKSFARISAAFLQVDSRAPGSQAVGQSPALFLESVRKADPESIYKLVSVNGRDGYEGVYLAKIFASGAKFVGVATGAFRESADAKEFSPTKSAANVVSAIIANDLVVGL